jgi:Clp amino terminal domain, pathogenicity island component
MFERYTEKARRTIFFGRYEASQFGSSYIETEHLLLGLLREDKALASHFLRSPAAEESIRKQIEAHKVPGQKLSTAVDLPLSHECKRVLAYGAEEAQRLNHNHIGTEHLLLGMLREENCLAARLLREQGLAVNAVREQLATSQRPLARGSASSAHLDRWLSECEARGGICVRPIRVANRSHFAIYAVDRPKENEIVPDKAPAEKLVEIQKRIILIVSAMERAIANHQFENARSYADQERKERENLRSLREQFNLEEPPPQVPLLCVGLIGDERFSEVQRLCDAYIAEGVTQVWLLNGECKRAYTFTKTEGLREFKDEILRLTEPALEMHWKTIFD